MKISLILLAAGDSRRFGSNKLLYELHGKPMYRYSVDEVAKLDTTVFAEKIVVSQYDEILDTLSREGYLTVRNTESYLGISHSIQLGLAASEEEAWCFLVADQPYLKAETLERFVEAFQKRWEELCLCKIWEQNWKSVYFYGRISKRAIGTCRRYWGEARHK